MFYTGYTCNPEQRIEMHNEGKVESTKYRRPLKLIYFEGCLNQQDATRREKYLKSGNGKIYLRNRLRNMSKILRAKKDRMVPLSKKLLEILREYYKQYEPKEYLFEGQNSGAYSEWSVQIILSEARLKAHVKERQHTHAKA